MGHFWDLRLMFSQMLLANHFWDTKSIIKYYENIWDNAFFEVRKGWQQLPVLHLVECSSINDACICNIFLLPHQLNQHDNIFNGDYIVWWINIGFSQRF